MTISRICLVFLCGLAPCWGQDDDPRAVLARTFYERSRLSAEIGRIAANSQSLIERSGADLAQESQRLEAFVQLLALAFSEANIRDLLLAHLEANLDTAKAEAVLSWLESPLATGFRRWEADALRVTEDRAGVYTRYGESLDFRDPAVAARAELVMRHNDARRVTAFSVTTSMAATRALLEAMNPYHAPEDRAGEGEIAELVATQSKEMIDKLDPAFLVVYLYAFREASDEDLATYAAFFETELGQWYVTATMDAMVAAYRTAGDQVGRDAARLLP